MREILFRGQTRKKGEKINSDGTLIEGNWVYGGIFQGQGDHSIIYSYDDCEKYPVYSATVGQFTGLCDKNGKKIFEGDIIVNDAGIKGIVEYFNELTWDGGCPHPGFYCKEWIEGIATDTDMFYHYNFSKVLVIGNIHDNPELLKEESE